MTEPGPQSRHAGPTSGDADPFDGRSETMTERLDRNWIEILQELRVIQTGTQILTGFLLALAFQPRFGELDGFQLQVYLILVVCSVIATVLGLAPVSFHRALFRRRAKPKIVTVANRLLILTIAFVGLVLTGTVLLIFDVVVGRAAGFVAGSATLVVVVVAWLVLPRIGVPRARAAREKEREVALEVASEEDRRA